MRLTCWPLDYKIICADLLSLWAHLDSGVAKSADNYVDSDYKKIKTFTVSLSFRKKEILSWTEITGVTSGFVLFPVWAEWWGGGHPLSLVPSRWREDYLTPAGLAVILRLTGEPRSISRLSIRVCCMSPLAPRDWCFPSTTHRKCHAHLIGHGNHPITQY